MNELFHSIAAVLQVLSALGVILLVLIQHGKGADMGAAFGSGASGSLFGATGSANFLSRITAASAAVFFASTLALAFAAHSGPREVESLMQGVTTPASSVPQVPGGASGGAGSAVPTVPAAPADAKSSPSGAQNDPATSIPK